MPTPFEIRIPDQRLAFIRNRIADFRWEDMPDAGGWRSGTGLADLKRLTDYWLNHYDWRRREAELNAYPHFISEIHGERIHFIRVRGNGTRIPVLLIHGWPGSFIEFESLIAPLVADGHDVVVPSLPGYAFSGRPATPMGPRRTGVLFHSLMAELFSGKEYFIQGGDWGAVIGAWIAHDQPQACAGLHLNMLLVHAGDSKPESDKEKAWAERRAALREEEAGYAHEQSTRPQTLGIAMTDSPIGVAAWILEKFGAWADVPHDAEGTPDLWQVFNEDQLITNIMLYLVTSAFVTSTWMYRGRTLEGSHMFPEGARIHVPTAVASFPDPVFSVPPRSLVEKTYNVVRWTEIKQGGHFPALEQPELLLADMRSFFAQVR
jgi:pimeloyl-ACP methyl ester carboxylesterase